MLFTVADDLRLMHVIVDVDEANDGTVNEGCAPLHGGGFTLAIGALRAQVLMQFLTEAIVLSMLGGIIGIVLGLALALGGVILLKVPFVIDPMIIILAFAFSGLVGTVFGYFPARRAASLNPIEALRHE